MTIIINKFKFIIITDDDDFKSTSCVSCSAVIFHGKHSLTIFRVTAFSFPSSLWQPCLKMWEGCLVRDHQWLIIFQPV